MMKGQTGVWPFFFAWAPMADNDKGPGYPLLPVGIGAGVAIGVAIGMAMDNVGAGIAIGIALGIAFGMGFRRTRSGGNERDGEK